MSSDMTQAGFDTTWKITWAEFSELQRKKIVKNIYLVDENVVFRFRGELSIGLIGSEKFGLSVIYEDGPLSELKGITVAVEIRTPNTPNLEVLATNPYVTKRGETVFWPDFDEMNVDTFKKKYGLETSNSLIYRMIIKLPSSVFNYRLVNDTLDEVAPAWASSMYVYLENAGNSEYSDVKLVSGDDRMFYCHRVVLGKQSKALAAMFRSPTSEKEQAGEFTFAKVDGDALDAILKYLYTGDCDVGHLPTPLIFQVADFGEQYDLKILKEKCTAVCWHRVVEKPDHAMEILRFADLHSEVYLKDRAMSVLMENYERLALQADDFSKGNDGDLQGKRLHTEFDWHILRRLWVSFPME